jgi:hypothetical protein
VLKPNTEAKSFLLSADSEGSLSPRMVPSLLRPHRQKIIKSRSEARNSLENAKKISIKHLGKGANQPIDRSINRGTTNPRATQNLGNDCPGRGAGEQPSSSDRRGGSSRGISCPFEIGSRAGGDSLAPLLPFPTLVEET